MVKVYNDIIICDRITIIFSINTDSVTFKINFSKGMLVMFT